MVIQKLNLVPTGGNYNQMHKYIKWYKINTSHFKGKAWNKGLFGIGKPIIPLEKILKKNCDFQSFKLKKKVNS